MGGLSGIQAAVLQWFAPVSERGTAAACCSRSGVTQPGAICGGRIAEGSARTGRAEAGARAGLQAAPGRAANRPGAVPAANGALAGPAGGARRRHPPPPRVEHVQADRKRSA